MKKGITVLVVDDDRSHRLMLKTLLKGWGYAVTEAEDGSQAIEAVREKAFDLILMDIRMVRISGLEALGAIKSYNPSIPVIIMTAYSSVETARQALKSGAYDYLTKPLDFDELKIVMERAAEHTSLKEENRRLKEGLSGDFDRRNIIGNSPGIITLLELVAKVASSDAGVLITGESGSGKELIAGAIHFNSPRRQGPFVQVNCAAITETLLESELFGHEKGAFTGALRQKEGRFRQAHSGTLFLDEVSEMSPGMQVKLLRALQEREITRVGGETPIKLDVRIIAATNRDLEQDVAEGRFREDLFYRLDVISLRVPPLRERREDIPILARHFLARFAEKNRKDLKGFTPQAMDRLLRYGWPGNVRELMNAVERSVVLSISGYVEADDLPRTLRTGKETAKEPTEAPVPEGALPLEVVEKATILKTLEAANGNKSETARRLGITRRTLHKKLKAYGVMD